MGLSLETTHTVTAFLPTTGISTFKMGLCKDCDKSTWLRYISHISFDIEQAQACVNH